MDEANIKAAVADDMRALLPEDAFRTTITVPEPTEADRRERRLSFTVEISQPDPAVVKGLAESLIRKHLGMQSN